jgi:enoyl-CoA hydratase/carnithine racemase
MLQQSLSMASLALAAAKAIQKITSRCPFQRVRPSSKPITARPLTVRDNDKGRCHVQAALEVLEQSLSKAPLALAAAKAAVDDGFEVPLPKGLAFERAHYTQLFATEDRLEALRAFAEKRKPNFKGC